MLCENQTEAVNTSDLIQDSYHRVLDLICAAQTFIKVSDLSLVKTKLADFGCFCLLSPS